MTGNDFINTDCQLPNEIQKKTVIRHHFGVVYFLENAAGVSFLFFVWFRFATINQSEKKRTPVDVNGWFS